MQWVLDLGTLMAIIFRIVIIICHLMIVRILYMAVKLQYEAYNPSNGKP